MNDLRKAAEQALEALRCTCDHLPAKTGVEREVDEAITALQVALAQPEQELVIDCPRCGHCCPERQWVALTDEDIDVYALDIGVTANKAPPWLVKYARDIEAKVKERNIAPYTKLDTSDRVLHREWVGLTEEEIKKIAKKHKWHEGNVEPHLMPVFRSLEAKLKEKNGG